MSTPRLSELEHRTFLLAISDGTLDLVFGLALIAVGVAWHLDGWAELAILAISFLSLGGLWRFLRRRVTEPRIGRVRLHPQRIERIRRARSRLVLVLVTIPAVLLPAAFLFPELRPPIGILVHLLLGGTVAAGGWLLDAERLYVYGVLMAGLFLLVRSAGYPHEISTLASGVTIATTGLVLMTAFVSKYPIEPFDNGHA